MGKHFLGDYKPVNVYRNNVKLAGWTATEKTGESASFANTYNHHFNSLIADGAEPQALADWHGVNGALSQVQTVQGKNLFDEQATALYTPNATYSADGLTLLASDYSPWTSKPVFITLAAGTYYLSTTGSRCRFQLYTADNTSLGEFTTPVALTLTATTGLKMKMLALASTYPWIVGHIQLELGATATPYEPFVPNSPSPDYPSVVTPNILAGSYKIARPAGGWWTITLTDDVRGISTYLDKVNLDLLTGKGKLRKCISKKVFDGTETILEHGTIAGWFYFLDNNLNASNSIPICPHFIGSEYKPATLPDLSLCMGGATPNRIIFRHNAYAGNAVGVKAWLAAEYAAGSPVTVYYVLATETVTDLTLTHVDTSDLTELTLADLGITVSSLDYPFTVYESNNNFISISNTTEVKQTVNLPTLRAIGTVKDRYNILSGVKTHKISEWINPADYAMTATPQTGYMQMFTPTISGALANSAIHGYKFNGAKLGNGMTIADYGKVHTDGTICITAAPADTGWGVTPTAAEVKAYFLGWMMCNADGTAPYLSGTKNWKHITDGLGLTATLPTATYAGYTPYRLLYQLATPTDEQLTGETVPTYPWHTDIAQTGDVLTTVTANAKVMD